MKKLSVITINYNNRDGLRKTIESVVNQTSRDFEYIIIDGNSTDGSMDVIKEYADKIDYWVSEPDKGIYNAMNKGILIATGEYCNFMNSGDCFHQNDVLEQVLPYFFVDIIWGKFLKVNDLQLGGYPYSNVSMLLFAKGGAICHQATFIKRKLFNGNLYDENLKIVSDWKFFIDELIFKNCSFKNINIIVADFDNTGISSTNEKITNNEREMILKEFLPERIYIDYVRFAKADSPLLELTPLFNKTNGFQKFIYKLVAFLIKNYYFLRKIFPKN
ncbi:MAG: glycosyltransferase family 2 protein [Bacteroidales bacterium]|nr:glycosyltransferase family 2 protein [Bacteroidales bacterium]